MAQIYRPGLPWYWLGQPTGYSSPILYSSGSGTTIPTTDAGYETWLAGGNGPTPWPRDGTGTVTTSALDEVLTAVGLPATGLTPPTQAQLLAAAYAQVTTLMAVARTYALPGSISVKCDATPSTGTDLAGLNAWGTASPTAQTSWVNDFGVVTTITGAQGVALAAGVIAYGQSVYDVLGTVVTNIAASSITTFAEVTAAAWPT